MVSKAPPHPKKEDTRNPQASKKETTLIVQWKKLNERRQKGKGRKERLPNRK